MLPEWQEKTIFFLKFSRGFLTSPSQKANLCQRKKGYGCDLFHSILIFKCIYRDHTLNYNEPPTVDVFITVHDKLLTFYKRLLSSTVILRLS